MGKIIITITMMVMLSLGSAYATDFTSTDEVNGFDGTDNFWQTWADHITQLDSELTSRTTQALGTTLIADDACATAIDITATGVASTDVVGIGYNSTPIGKTGYDPTAGSELSIRAYPGAGHIYILVCNNTGAAVTPAAMTINVEW